MVRRPSVSSCSLCARLSLDRQARASACAGSAHASGCKRTGPRKTVRVGDADKQSQDAVSPRGAPPARVPLSSRRAPAQGSGGDAGVGSGRAIESDGYKQLYSNGQIAVIARRDGTSEARYFNGSVAVSLDAGRVTAMYRNGDVAVTSDENGNGMVCLPSCLILYNHSQGTDDAHLCDMLADVATLVSHVLPDVVGCAHWGAPTQRPCTCITSRL